MILTVIHSIIPLLRQFNILGHGNLVPRAFLKGNALGTRLRSWERAKYGSVFQWLLKINSGLQLARKHAWIFVRGHYVFQEANSVPRA